MDPNTNPQMQGEEGGGMAIASLVLGIIALLLAWIPIIGFISWILAPLALILGFLALKGAKRGLAIGGLITGGLALLICILYAFVFAAAISAAPEDLEQLQADLEAMEEYQN